MKNTDWRGLFKAARYGFYIGAIGTLVYLIGYDRGYASAMYQIKVDTVLMMPAIEQQDI